MAVLIDQLTLGKLKILALDSDPRTGAGYSAEVGSYATINNQSSPVGKLFIKVGASNTDWNIIATEESNGTVELGQARRLALYPSTDNLVDDVLLENSQNVTVDIAAQASRTAPINYRIPNPGNAVTAADFVLTEGSQTINGDKTFGNNVTINGDLDVNGTLNLPLNGLVAGTNQLVLSSGNVGIGTTSPSENLEVRGSVGSPATSGTAQNGVFRLGGSDGGALDFGTIADGFGSWLQSTDRTNLAARYPLLLNPAGGAVTIGTTTLGSGALNVMGGNVGIGTTSPGAALDINGQIKIQGGTPGAGKVLTSDAAGLATWSSVSTSSITGTLPVANGGTGATTFTTNGIIYGNTTSALGVTAAGTQYQVLQAGASGIPSFGALALNQSAAVTGTLPVANGGTGATTATANQIFAGPTTGAAAAPSFRAPVGADMAITATSPLTWTSSTSGNGTLAMPVATTSANGYLSSTDWNTFNNKVSSQWVTTGSDIYYNTGKVGIGTASPSAPLDIANSTTGLALRAGNTASAFTSNQILLSYGGTNTYQHAIKTRHNNGGATGNNIDFYLWNYDTDAVGTVGTKHVMTLEGSGNVGIGTTEPSAPLHLTGASTNAVPTLAVDTSATTNSAPINIYAPSLTVYNYVQIRLGVGNALNNAAEYRFNYVGNGSTSNRLDFSFYGNPNSTMSLLANGNFGIGTTSPAQKLDVTGNVVASSFGNTGEGSFIGLFKDLGSLPGYPANRHPTVRTDFDNLYFSVGGNFSSFISSNGTYTAMSDRNRKENFVELNPQEVLEKLDDLPMMEWNFKGEDPNIRHIGPIAQDFHAAFHLNGSDDTKISHIDPAGVAIVGVKGLLHRVKDLERQNAALEREVRELKNDGRL